MISYLELCWPSCLVEQNHLCNSGKGNYGEHSFGIVLNLNQCFFLVKGIMGNIHLELF